MATTRVGLVFDESGSMQPLKTEAIQTVREYIKTLQNEKKKKDKILFTLVKFDTKYEVVFDNEPVENIDVENINYAPTGMTALLDSLYRCIVSIEEQAKKKDNVIVTVMTDGEENSSREITREALKKKIEEKSDWTFVYLGKDASAFSEAASIGIRQSYTYDASPLGMQTNTAALGSSMRSYLHSPDGNKTFSM